MEELAKLLANLDTPGVTELVVGTGRQVTVRKGGAYVAVTPEPVTKAELGRWLVGTAFEALIPDHEGMSEPTEITVIGRRVRAQLTRRGKDLLVRIEKGTPLAKPAPPSPVTSGIVELDDLLLPSGTELDAPTLSRDRRPPPRSEPARAARPIDKPVELEQDFDSFDVELSEMGAVALDDRGPPGGKAALIDALEPQTAPPVRFKSSKPAEPVAPQPPSRPTPSPLGPQPPARPTPSPLGPQPPARPTPSPLGAPPSRPTPSPLGSPPSRPTPSPLGPPPPLSNAISDFDFSVEPEWELPDLEPAAPIAPVAASMPVPDVATSWDLDPELAPLDNRARPAPRDLVEPPRVAPKPESPKLEPRAELPRLDPPRIDSPRIDSPRIDSPRIDPPRIDSSPRIESPQINAPRIEPPRIDPPPKLESTKGAPRIVDERASADSIAAIVRAARKRGASDLHIAWNRPVMIRVIGALVPLEPRVLTPAEVDAILLPLVGASGADLLRSRGYVDLAIDVPDAGRLRGNVSRAQTGLKGSFRLAYSRPPTLDELHLPKELAKVVSHHQGLVVLAGPSGHGKTTTLAALVDLINESRAHHILTIEDPVEIVHPRKRAVVSQREVGRHTNSFAAALKASLREDPDVIVIGELRDRETVEIALTAAETGHLVMATMSTPSAAKTIDRLIDMFPPDDQSQVRASLAGALRAIIAMRLLPRADKTGLVPAVELLTGVLPLAALIRDNRLFQLPNLMQRGRAYGMIRLDDSLIELVRAGTIDEETALRTSDSKKELHATLHPPAAPVAKKGLFGRKEDR